MKKMSDFVAVLFTIALPLSGFASSESGHDGGNGGDVIRGEFLKKGAEVIDFLINEDPGKALVHHFGLSIVVLKRELKTTNILVVDHSLEDNTGSLVDAIGVRGKIQLDRKQWTEHLYAGQFLHKLVFHEMLRATGKVNDDEYRISKMIEKDFESPSPQSTNPLFTQALRAFQRARLAKTDDLKLGQRVWYNCVKFSQGESSTSAGLFFEKWKDDVVVLTFENGQKSYLLFDTTHATGLINDTFYTIFVRTTSEGDLIIEFTEEPRFVSDPIPAVSSSDLAVTQYTYCRNKR